MQRLLCIAIKVFFIILLTKAIKLQNFFYNRANWMTKLYRVFILKPIQQGNVEKIQLVLDPKIWRKKMFPYGSYSSLSLS